MAELGLADVKESWIAYVLDDVFIDENSWTQQLTDAVASSAVKSMTAVLSGHLVKIEKK